MRPNSFKRNCLWCGKEFMTCPSLNQKACSRSCFANWRWSNPIYRKKMSAVHKGKPSSMKGVKHKRESILKMRAAHFSGKEKTIHANGYIYIYAPDHPRSGKGSRVPEQILIAEKALGRPLRYDEEVHHINGIKSDNRKENLLICSEYYHHFLHAKIQGLGTKIRARREGI